MKKTLWVLIGLLIVSNGLTIYLLYKNQQVKPENVVKEVTKTATSTELLVVDPKGDADNDGINNLDEQELYKTDPLKADTDGDGLPDKEEIDLGRDPLVVEDTVIGSSQITSELIEVVWQKPISVTPEKFFGTEKEMKAKFPTAFDTKGNFIWPDNGWNDSNIGPVNFINKTNSNNQANFYNQFYFIEKVGKVKTGVYQNKDFYTLRYTGCLGGCPADSIVRFIDSDNGYVCLAKHSNDCFAPGIFKADNKLYVTNLATPKIIRVPNSKFLLKQVSVVHASLDINSKADFAFKADDYDVYFDQKNGLFRILRSDNYFVFYSYDLAFRDESYGSLNIKWLNGTSSTESYDSKAGSCGIGFGYAYADYASLKNLKQTGTASDGSIIYELVDKNDSHLKQVYNGYDTYGAKKISYEEYITSHPLIFWQDFLGRFVVFSNTTYVPMAECGKPVIYLYPEKEGKVSVQVSPNGGFKLAEPAYNNGWEVMAKPNGELTNLSDGKKYPYLFWEGYAYNYIRPNEGFVVAEKQVKPFLKKVLAKLGLIKVEADEFIAFWEPKMHEQPYYFISFVPQEKFEALAPLNVSPAPDTVIRVFMDYQGLEKPVVTAQPKIITPFRKGFTVVEWGGAVHK